MTRRAATGPGIFELNIDGFSSLQREQIALEKSSRVVAARSGTMNAHIGHFSSPGAFGYSSSIVAQFGISGAVFSRCPWRISKNRPGLGTRVVEDKGLMNDPRELPAIREASRVSATNVHVGYIVPALGYAFTDSLNAPLGIIQTNEE